MNRRPIFRFSMRFMLLLVMSVALFLAFIANNRKRQISSIQVIEQAGGRAVFDWQMIPVYDQSGKKKYSTITHDSDVMTAPVWLRRIFGDELFQSVESVAFLHPNEINDDVWRALESMSNLEKISLYNAPELDLSDEEVERIKDALQKRLNVRVYGPFDYGTTSLKWSPRFAQKQK